MQTMNGIVHHRNEYVRRGAKMKFRCANVNDATCISIVYLMRPYLFNETYSINFKNRFIETSEALTTVLKTSVLFGC